MELTPFRVRIALVAAAWLLGGIQVLLYAVSYQRMEEAVPWSSVLWTWLYYGLPALALPWLVARALAAPFDRSRWLRQVPAHVGRAALLSLGGAAAYFALRRLASLLGGEPYELNWLVDSLLRGRFLSDLYLYGAISVGASAAASALRLRERELVAARLESELATARLRLLKAQLDPHFLFNVLNAVLSLVRRDPDGAERMISRLSGFLRRILESGGIDLVTLRQELDDLGAYVEIQKTRFRDALAFDVDVPSDLLDVPVPHMLLQPLVENSIQHGAVPRRVLHVVVRARRIAANRLKLTVEDDGLGFHGPQGPAGDRSDHHGVGLATTRARLRTLYDGDAHIELSSKPGEGTIVRLTLPAPPTPEPDAARGGAEAEGGQAT